MLGPFGGEPPLDRERPTLKVPSDSSRLSVVVRLFSGSTGVDPCKNLLVIKGTAGGLCGVVVGGLIEMRVEGSLQRDSTFAKKGLVSHSRL